MEPTKKHYLFGYPISHSASPALHNNVWKEVDPSRHYALVDTYDVSQPHFKQMVREDPAFAGAAVTMPLKVTVTNLDAGILDDLTPAARAIGAVNTIVVEADPTKPNGRRFIGTNSDTLGVRNSLLRALAISAGLAETSYVSPTSGIPSTFAPNRYATFIIGGGGTTRSSIYALNALNLSPIYLVNRDPDETAAIVAAFPTVDLRPLHSVADWERERTGPDAKEIPIAVGCIPAVDPETDGEKMVYELAHRFLDAPYAAATNGETEEHIKPPQKRHFLEMAYKPRRTPMLIRAEQAGWTSVEGVQAMIEQGFAQDRMWLLNDSSMTVACLTGEGAPIPPELERKVRNIIETMGDVKVEKKEAWGGKPDLAAATASK